MQFKVTMQYANSAEIFFAEFYDIHDAKIFIDKMLIADDGKSRKPTYRLFEENKLIIILNPEINANQHGEYASGDHEIPPSIEEPFNVIIQDNSNAELTIAKFSKLKHAQTFVTAKLLTDVEFNIDMTYFILDGDKFVEKSNQTMLSVKQDARPRHMVRPSPFSYRLRPRGTAYGIYNTGEDEDEKNK